MNQNSNGSDNVDMCSGQSASVLSNFVRCPYCSQARFFKGERGLKVHIGKIHKCQHVLPSPTISVDSEVPLNTSQIPFWQSLSEMKNSVPVLKRIPRGARPSVAQKLSNCIKHVVSVNSISAWEQLLTFPYRILHIKNNSTQRSLTTQIKENCSNNTYHFESKLNHAFSQSFFSQSNKYKYIENKIREGDIRGASRLLFSSDVVAPYSPDTLAGLQSKHPPASIDLSFPEPPGDDTETLSITAKDVFAAVCSFRSGSAAGLDGLTPQHLKDLMCPSAGEAGDALLKELTALVNLMLSGNVDEGIIHILYGANLCALRKRDGGIRPIAVGSTLRRLAAKICCKYYSTELAAKFQPLQLGFGSKGGCEAAIHALSTYLGSGESEVILKVDLRNAFNSVNRDTLLTQAKLETPHIYKFLWQCYRHPTKLIYKDHLLESAVGCQQGDPLGPVIFSLAIHPIIQQLNSKFNIWYLDDGTLGGDVPTVLQDLELMKNKFQSIGLQLNSDKCEIFISDTTDRPSTTQKFNHLAPNIKILEKASLRLLGSPVLEDGFHSFIEEKIQNFENIADCLQKISVHSAFTILRLCLFVPKFTHALRSSQFWQHLTLLAKIDNILQNTLSKILNVALNDRAWLQASLPVRLGGLGVRKITDVSLPAFLSSVHGTEELTRKILINTQVNSEVSCKSDAINAWKVACPNTELPGNLFSQRQWDAPLCKLVRDSLIRSSSHVSERARLLAVGEWESGLWIQALPSPNIGTMLDDTTFRLATCLRLGAPCVSPHRCLCGEAVDSLGHHGLSCGRSAGRISRHACINDIIRRALATAGVPAIREPNGLAREDGRRPDGMSLLPWKMGRPLVWDATCVDTLAPSHLSGTAGCAGAAAASAENLKRRKYCNLTGDYIFEPFGVETLGTWGPSARFVYKDLTKRLIDATRDQRAGYYLAQRISIAIQRGNAASLLGTFPVGDDVEEFHDALCM